MDFFLHKFFYHESDLSLFQSLNVRPYRTAIKEDSRSKKKNESITKQVLKSSNNER